MSGARVEVRNLSREYRLPGVTPVVLFRDLNFTVEPGEMLAIVGQSGAGKSTLLHLLAGLDAPTAGEVAVDRRALGRMSAPELATFRNRSIGYVWQAHYLLPEFSALENVALPLLARGVPQHAARAAAVERLTEIGLNERADHRAGELSGGEQQRVALARALVGNPRLLLADEPTGNLDAENGAAVFALLQSLHAKSGTTTILVTHNEQFARECGRILRLGGRSAPVAAAGAAHA